MLRLPFYDIIYWHLIYTNCGAELVPAVEEQSELRESNHDNNPPEDNKLSKRKYFIQNVIAAW